VTYHARIGFRRCGTSLPQLSSGPLGTNKMQLNSAEENMTIISNLAEFRLATIFTLLVVCSPNLLSSCNTNSPQKNIGRSIVSGDGQFISMTVSWLPHLVIYTEGIELPPVYVPMLS